MNNDISTDLKYINTTRKNNSHKALESKTESQKVNNSNINIEDSMAFLGNMGYAQVNMKKTGLKNNTMKYINEYIKNPDYAQLHTDFCDSLVQRGYSLEDAVVCTDKVFAALSDKRIYE